MNHERIIAQREATIPLSLYIHFPWCLSKCPYCDFNSYKLSDKNSINAYIDRLLFDLAIEGEANKGRELKSIYFGGGTPSLIPVDQIAKIIGEAKRFFKFSPNIEISIEINPGTVDQSWCQELRNTGINRASIGVQSFNDAILKSIQRIHTAKQALSTVESIKSAGFTNFNLDLMFGLPGQAVDTAVADLKATVSLMPPHLSWYQLTLIPEFLAREPSLKPLESEVLWDIQQAGQSFLRNHGLKQYEVSAYSNSPDNMCRHNINYWQYGDYIGIGAGAHGKITSGDKSVTRYSKVALPHAYIASNELVEVKNIVEKDRIPLEFMINALRLYQPITYDLFQKRTGFTIDAIAEKLHEAKELGLIELKDKTIITTDHGKNFLNDLLEIFL